MSRKFKSLLNLVTLPSDPNGSEGDVFFNTTEKALKIHNGTEWYTIIQNTDPAPFYTHTHTYDGDVHTVNIGEPITFKEINNEDPATVQEEIPAIIGLDGGDVAGSQQDATPTFEELTRFDGGNVSGN
jgi:hypothetical protein